ncbi:MAG: SlyX family protein [Gammaproteobacteria bacterium]|nr:SlyX family protein [Gammaproteobacteria bacterium]MCW9057318.1 SlyX family protein [Gammaproteobacteria bacterium]
MEERLIELESRVSFQEHTLQELNDILTAQQQELGALRLAVQELDRRLRALAPTPLAGAEEETPPPHY